MTDHMNPALRAEVEGLQGSMVAAAERRAALPARFTSQPAVPGNRVTITDTVTGRSATVGLCDYGGARQVLAAFFGEPKQGMIVPAGPPVSIAKVILYAGELGWPGAGAALSEALSEAPEDYPPGDPAMSVADLARAVAAGHLTDDDTFDTLADWLEPSATYWLNANIAPEGTLYGWRDLAFYLGDADFWGPDGPDEM